MGEEKKGSRVTAYYATAEDYKRMGHYTIGTFHRFVGTETRPEIKDQPTPEVTKAPASSKSKVDRAGGGLATSSDR